MLTENGGNHVIAGIAQWVRTRHYWWAANKNRHELQAPTSWRTATPSAGMGADNRSVARTGAPVVNDITEVAHASQYQSKRSSITDSAIKCVEIRRLPERLLPSGQCLA